MKKTILTFFLLLILAGNAVADNFQITYLEGGYTYNMSYTSIKLFYNNREVFNGYTDKYGRVIISNIRSGRYQLEINYNNKVCRAEITIDNGSRQFKSINFRSTNCQSTVIRRNRS